MFRAKKNIVKPFFFLLIGIEVIFYLISGVCKFPDTTILNLEERILYSCMHPLEAWNDMTMAFLGIGFLVWFGLLVHYLQYNRNYHENPEGSAEWGDVDEVCKRHSDPDEKNNRILTQNLKVSLETGLSNNNMAVIASSGDFKTTSLVEQNALQFGSTYIFLDVKGELLRKLGNAFKRAGYNVRCLDFCRPELSDRYNPFVYIEKEVDVVRTVNSLHESTRPMKSQYGASADPFWDDAVKLLLQALVYAVWLEGRRTGRVGTMNRLNELLNMESSMAVDPNTGEPATKLKIYMDDLKDKYGEDYPPVLNYYGLKEGASDTVSSVVLMLRGMLQICNTAEVRRIFEDNDINIRELGTGVGGDPEKKTVLFLVMPAINNYYNWIMTLYYDQTFDILERLADFEIEGKLPVRVEFWMDEVYTGPKPTELVRLLGIIRGWNMSIILILQSVSQMKDMWQGSKWEIVKDNLAVVLYLGSGPFATESHEAISKALGKGTFDIVTDNMHTGQNASTGLNWSQKGISLMTPEDIMMMPQTDAIVFMKSEHPMYDTKAIPFDRPDLGYTAPQWLKKRYEDALGLGPYRHPVYTYYDPEHFHYITLDRGVPFQIIEDKKDIQTLQAAAENDKDIYTFDVGESELLYLSWGRPAYSQDEIEKAYDRIMEEKNARKERLKGLLVLQDVDDPDYSVFEFPYGNKDKTGWDKCRDLKELITEHWNDLSAPEQEEVAAAMDDGLTEEQLYTLFLTPLVDMPNIRKTFAIENSRRG